MTLKTYVCKGCGKIEEYDLYNLTFPQCPKCSSIMAEPIEYNNIPVSKYIPSLESLWCFYYPDIPVQVQLIYRNRRFKFRWFDGPAVDDVKQNSQFMSEYNKICELAGIPKNRRTHKRAFKQYIGGVPPRTFDSLSEAEQMKVKNLIESYILSVYEETYVLDTILEDIESNHVLTVSGDEDTLGTNFLHYTCKKCNSIIRTRKGSKNVKDSDVIQHVINKHLNENTVIKMSIICAPKKGTKPVFKSNGVTPASDFIFINSNGSTDFICGSCGHTLCKNVHSYQVIDEVFLCPVCGNYNVRNIGRLNFEELCENNNA